MSCCHHCVCVCLCVCVCVCVCVVSVTVCGVTVFALSNTVTHRARGGLRAVGAPACRDSCAELTNPTTWGVTNSYSDTTEGFVCRVSRIPVTNLGHPSAAYESLTRASLGRAKRAPHDARHGTTSHSGALAPAAAARRRAGRQTTAPPTAQAPGQPWRSTIEEQRCPPTRRRTTAQLPAGRYRAPTARARGVLAGPQLIDR